MGPLKIMNHFWCIIVSLVKSDLKCVFLRPPHYIQSSCFNDPVLYIHAVRLSTMVICVAVIDFYRDLGHNQIVEFPILSLSKLSYLHLEDNNFTYIGADVFVNVSRVQTLKLSHNRFVMHKDALKPLTRLREL